MAEGVVNFVLGKLADAVLQEILSQYKVHAEVEKVYSELGWIRAFLKHADKKQITDDMQKHWVKEVRDVAYSIEDVIDTFLLEVSQKPQKSGMLEAVKKMIKRTKKIPAVHKLVDDINEINKKMKVIEDNRVRYGIQNLGGSSGDIVVPLMPPVVPEFDPNIVGFEADQDHLVNELLDVNTKRRSVVSIWGPGGIGKTALAQKVYNHDDVNKQFVHRIWVTISRRFDVVDVLRNIAQKLKCDNIAHDQPIEEEKVILLKTIHKNLGVQRYLIILDEVWTSDLWTHIKAAFPDGSNGSRVLITTRLFQVAKGADPTCEPHKLEFLTKELSRELFLKTIFPLLDPNKNSFNDLSDIPNQFLDKCGGLPLALVILGGLLSNKKRSYTDWSSMLGTMNWHFDGKNCMEIIGTSYDDLPYALKSCFMYFAAFPADYSIHAPSLLQMWIADGFIPPEYNITLEETAKSFLVDLIQRSMVQVDPRSDGSIEYIRIHNLLWDLAVQKAREDNFLMVYSHPYDQMSLSKARRAVIHNLDCDQLVSQNLRTLFCSHNKRMPNCSKQRLLKVVRTGDDRWTIEKLQIFKGMTQLRYLKLAGTLSDECGEECFEKVMCGMKFLQTIDIKELSRQTIDGDRELELPDCAWHIKTLRHVHQKGLGPPPSAKLTNLQTLTWMRIRESWETELPDLPNLHTLELEHTSSSWNVVVTFLATLEHLISLRINGYPTTLDILDMKNFRFYQGLQYLTLDARILLNPNEMTLHEDMLPPHLTFLQIIDYKFQQDLMPVLEKLQCLKTLILNRACQNRKMRCSSGGFSQLEVLKLLGLNMLEEWEIEEGAMPILKELYMEGCDQLGVLPGLQKLTNRKIFKWSLRGQC